jgi:hypothetical protein
MRADTVRTDPQPRHPRRLIAGLALALAFAGALAACGDAGPSAGTGTAASAAPDPTLAATVSDAVSTGGEPDAAMTTAGCADDALTLVVQQEITALNALTTVISRDWFIDPQVQADGIERVGMVLTEFEAQAEALRSCRAEATADQAALVEPALKAITAARAFTRLTLAIAEGRTIDAAQKELRRRRPAMERATARLTAALTALSASWERWQAEQTG